MNHILWIDALDFNNYGGWKSDTQFTHLMGSGYLLACETPGVPVGDAATVFSIPEGGMYRVWVRARNWYYPHSPGRFAVSIDDRAAPAELGALPSHDWVWQIAGDFSLAAGDHRLALCDRTGYFGRCSTVVLTDDMEYIPPRPTAEFEAERARIRGISLEPQDEGRYDVIVAGGGPGGVPAAIAAARHGAKTLIISNRPVLGGNSSTEAGVGFNGASARQPNAREGGIAEEIIRTKGYLGCSWTEALRRLCDAEENLTVRDNLHVCGAEVKDGRIGSITARHTLAGTRHRFTGSVFIDATGDGWLLYHAGARYRLGREAKWQFGEEFAPESADLNTMSGCIMGSLFEDTGAPVAYAAPEWVPVFPEGRRFGRNIERIGPAWWNEAPNTLDDVYDAELARDELFRVMLGYFNYLKNLWDEKEKAVNYAFTRMPYIDAKRESRRIVGDYTLTQNDCVAGRDFPDTVAHTGWPIDLHHPRGIYSGEEGPFFSNTHVPLVKVPYRCLYSRNIDNLFAAGRNVSVTHVALGTARVQNTIAAMAQAAGTAAALCLQKGVTPRELGQNHLDEYREILLRDDQYIPGLGSRDAADLARGCRVTASSVSPSEIYTRHLGLPGPRLPLDRQRATFFARDVSEHIPCLYLLLVNETDGPVDLTIHLREQADPDGYVTREDLLVMTRPVPPGEHWVEFPVNVRTKLRYLWIMNLPTAGLSWPIWKYPPLDWTRSERHSDAEKFENIRWESHCLSLEPPADRPARCGPEAVVNGYSRAVSAQQYEWVSGETEGLPQWITLTFPEPTAIDTVHITFDSDMTNPAMLHPIARIPEKLVTDYTLSALTGEGWRDILTVGGNYLRKRVHRFPAVTARELRVTVTGSGDHKTARIFEIRAYGEKP